MVENNHEGPPLSIQLLEVIETIGIPLTDYLIQFNPEFPTQAFDPTLLHKIAAGMHEPSDPIKQRIRTTIETTRILGQDHIAGKMLKSWFMGMIPRLNGNHRLRLLR